MEDTNTVFDDIMHALHEVEEHQKGNKQLNSNIVSMPDESGHFPSDQKIIKGKQAESNAKIR